MGVPGHTVGAGAFYRTLGGGSAVRLNVPGWCKPPPPGPDSPMIHTVVPIPPPYSPRSGRSLFEAMTHRQRGLQDNAWMTGPAPARRFLPSTRTPGPARVSTRRALGHAPTNQSPSLPYTPRSVQGVGRELREKGGDHPPGQFITMTPGKGWVQSPGKHELVPAGHSGMPVWVDEWRVLVDSASGRHT